MVEEVQSLEHDGEVIKARSNQLLGSQSNGVVASMTNSGTIHLYEFQSLKQILAGDRPDATSSGQKIASLTGL